MDLLNTLDLIHRVNWYCWVDLYVCHIFQHLYKHTLYIASLCSWRESEDVSNWNWAPSCVQVSWFDWKCLSRRPNCTKKWSLWTGNNDLVIEKFCVANLFIFLFINTGGDCRTWDVACSPWFKTKTKRISTSILQQWIEKLQRWTFFYH